MQSGSRAARAPEPAGGDRLPGWSRCRHQGRPGRRSPSVRAPAAYERKRDAQSPHSGSVRAFVSYLVGLGRVELPTSRLSGEAGRNRTPTSSRTFIGDRPPTHRLSADSISDFPALIGHHNRHHAASDGADVFTSLDARPSCECGGALEWRDCDVCGGLFDCPRDPASPLNCGGNCGALTLAVRSSREGSPCG